MTMLAGCDCDSCALGRKLVAAIEEQFPADEDGSRSINLSAAITAMSTGIAYMVLAAETPEEQSSLLDMAINTIDKVFDRQGVPIVDDGSESIH